MPNRKRHFLSLIAILAATLGSNLPAQQSPQEERPTPPFVINAPAPCSWNVGVIYKRTYPEPTDKSSTAHKQWQELQKILPAITKIVVNKSENRRLEITTYAQGTKDEKYCVDGLQFLRMAAFAPGDIMVGQPGSDKDFHELDWITLEDYTGIKQAQGKKCFVFVSGTEGSRMEAWIDTKTKLPVKFSNCNYDRVYEFSKLQPGGLDPSPAIAKRVNSQFEGNQPH